MKIVHDARPPTWKFTVHAERRRVQMRLTTAQVVAVLDDPEIVYPVMRDRRIATGDGLAVVFEAVSGHVITILWDGLEGRAVA
jgi:hypothetical protein